MVKHRGEESCRDVDKTRDETSSDQQVLWAYNWQVKGPNGRATAQLDHPRGWTRSFQLRFARQAVGTARVLSRGVTMHQNGDRDGTTTTTTEQVDRTGVKLRDYSDAYLGCRSNNGKRDGETNPRASEGTTKQT